MSEIVVLKIGTNTILTQSGEINEQVALSMFVSLKDEMKSGRRFMLVTSGAVAFGRHVLEDKKLSRHVAGAVGQPYVLSAYEKVAREQNIKIAELLLSRPHITERSQFLQLQSTVDEMFDRGVLPIVNEHDALVTDTSWSFGDNDSLAAGLAIAFKAERLLLLTHIDGLFTGDPAKGVGVELIPEVKNVNTELMKYCSTESSADGRGGMVSKLKSARLCTNAGIEVQILNGLNSDAVTRALQGGNAGTRCLPRVLKKPISNRERWILAAKSSAATIQVDSGAAAALEKGKSLLAVGVKRIIGRFNKGEIVEINNNDEEGIAFGIADFNSLDLEDRSFKEQHNVQIMHADNIMVFK